MSSNARKVCCIVISILLVISIVSLIQVFELKSQIQNLHNNLAGQMQVMKSEIDSIYGNIDEKLKKQVSAVTEYNCEFGEFDTEAKTVKATLTVHPKSLTDSTEFSVEVNGKSYPLKKSGTTEFKATVDADAFSDEAGIPLLVIKDGEKTTTELLEDISFNNLYQRYLPAVESAVLFASETYHNGILKVNGDLSVSCFLTQKLSEINGIEYTFDRYWLEVNVNGDKISEKDITSLLTTESDNGNSLTLFMTLSESYKIDKNDLFVITLAAEDSAGIVHRIDAYEWFNNEGEKNDTMGYEEKLYDKDGNLLI